MIKPLAGIILMSVLTTASVAGDTTAARAVEIDGAHARAIAAAVEAAVQKLPDADFAQYTVKAKRDGGEFQVIFVPRLAPGEKPALGGRTSQGQELNVWVSADDFAVSRTAFAR